MLPYILYFSFFIVFVPLIIVIHELGHYIFARLAGIPSENIKIVFSFPPHVALKTWQEDWISPTEYERYIEEYIRFDNQQRFQYFFMAGGLMIETVLLVLFSMMIYITPANNRYIFMLVFISLFVNLVYMVVEMINSLKKQKPAGDISGMWIMASKRTVLFLFLFFVIRMGLIYLYLNFL